MRELKFARKLKRAAQYGCTSALVLAWLLMLAGCSGESSINPVFRPDDTQIQRAITSGKNAILGGVDPNSLLTSQMIDVNLRVSSEVILRSAGCCWPTQEVAYQIASAGDSTDAGIRKAVNAAKRVIEREMKCVATIQLPMNRDPGSITFALRTNTAVEYPPIAVEKPVFVREVTSIYDPSAPAGALYLYVVRFPVRGGPGVPPVGPNVSSLNFVVKDGESEAQVNFPIPKQMKSNR